jgi:hypothetical protein
MSKHPMQPIELDAEGTPRFKANAIVVWLFSTKRISLNDIPIDQFDDEDCAQFWQLLGYSVSGYGELSFIPKDIVEEADKIADALVDAQKRRR